MIELRFLETERFERIHGTFAAAFAEYAVPLRSSLDELRRMTVRRGADWTVSVGAYDGERLVAVMAVALGEWRGERTAYDVFTGVAPEVQGRGLAGKLFAHARPRLAERGVRRFLLEVLRDNEPAVRTYRRAGFVAHRELECLRVERDRLPEATAGTPAVRPLAAPDWDLLRTFHDWRPSWQNSVDSVLRAAERSVVLAAVDGDAPIGYAVLFPEEGDLAQLAVARAHRRTGVGTRLLGAVRARLKSGSELRIVNVPSDAAGDLAFYAAAGAKQFTGQYEMELELG